MISADPAQLMNEIIDRIQQINLLTIRITQSDNFFSSLPSLRLPQFQHPELGMLKLVSWLYAFYQELGKPNIDFIKERFELYLDENNSRKNHVKTVLRLRTLFQHNLDPMSQSDNSTQEICELWFKDVCGSSYPEDDQQWSLCLVGLLRDTKNFLVDVHKCIQAIDADEARVEILRQWAFRRKQYHPQHEFDRVIQIVAADLGRDINPKKFSNRYYSTWIQQLQIKETYEFEVEARKLVERAILEDTQASLPIIGTDIMREFSIGPGRRVGELLKRAIDIFDVNPSLSKSDLLLQLQESLTV